MKKIYLLAFFATIFLAFSCGSNNTEENPDGYVGVEEGKKQLEDNTIDLLTKVENFKDNNALKEIIELAEYLSSNNAFKTGNSKKTIANTLSNVSNLQTTDFDIAIFNAKQAITIISDTPLKDDFNKEKGIYNWNPQNETFDKTGSSDDIIYNITYNNGKVAIFSFTDFTTKLVGDDSEELPTLAKANLTINGASVFSQNYAASFINGQLIPSKIDNTTTIGEFSFVTSFSNSNNSTIKQSFAFNLSNDVILGYNLIANGNFNDDANGNVEDVIDDANLSFQFLNAALTLNAKDTGFNSDSELNIDEQIALLNSNTSAELNINGKSVAKNQFYKDQDTYTDYVYNSNTQQWQEVEVTEDIVNARFLFEDGTTSDFNTYIDGSFTSVEDKFNTVFEAYEDLFSDI